MQSATVASSLMGTMAIMQFIAVIGMIPLCIKFGPAPSYRLVVVLFGLSALSYGVLYYAGMNDAMSLLLLISAVAGLGRGGINYVPWNTYTYIADVDEVITGQRREGIFAGIMTLTRKASGLCCDVGRDCDGVFRFCLRPKCSGSGGKPYHFDDFECGHRLRTVHRFLYLLRFKLNLHTHSILREETVKMRDAGHIVPEQITPEAKATVEMLAGMPYESLWGITTLVISIEINRPLSLCIF